MRLARLSLPTADTELRPQAGGRPVARLLGSRPSVDRLAIRSALPVILSHNSQALYQAGCTESVANQPALKCQSSPERKLLGRRLLALHTINFALFVILSQHKEKLRLQFL